MGQIKSLLEKLGKKSLLTQDYLNMIVFKINSHVKRNQGSALMRFFGREVVTYMPTLVKKRFDQAALIQKRSEQQMQVAKKLGRRSVDMFKAGECPHRKVDNKRQSDKSSHSGGWHQQVV